jgi:D-alanyl-D-alanine carboxypeptidase
MCLGWQEIEGVTYYFREDGTMAVGRVTLDGVNYHFDRRGAYVLLVNKWNPVPEGYEPQLKTYKGWSMDASCYDAMVQMLTDLADTGYFYKITSVYRTEKTQQKIWNNRYNGYISQGYSKERALELVAQSVAEPGTSEHHLGLAIDITGDNAKKWLAENCWKYGFIVRYPEGKTEITGIIYEPWHYRYVGVDLAMELKDSGLCLEEYMEQLTTE